MPRIRQATNILHLKGAIKHDPLRHEARKREPPSDVPLGDPPDHMSEELKVCWREIVDLAHAGTLCRADRMLIEHGANILFQLRENAWVCAAPILVRWENVLAKLGMTPADRSRVQVSKSKSEEYDALDEFSRQAG